MELQRIEIKKEYDYPEDLKRIQKVIMDMGFIASLDECEELWDKFSDSMAAGWMMLPDSDEGVWHSISGYITN